MNVGLGFEVGFSLKNKEKKSQAKQTKPHKAFKSKGNNTSHGEFSPESNTGATAWRGVELAVTGLPVSTKWMMKKMYQALSYQDGEKGVPQEQMLGSFP